MRFDKALSKTEITSFSRPILYITRIIFVTGDKDWINRLFNSSLRIKFECLDEIGKTKSASEESLSLISFVTPYHLQPILEVNRLFSLESQNSTNKSCASWRTTVELTNLKFGDNENLEVLLLDYDKFKTVDGIINEIRRLQAKFLDLSSSTNDLLKLIPHLRLDWAQDDNEFSDEFNIGVTKPILLTGLAHHEHKLKSSNLLIEHSKIALLLTDAFLTKKHLTVSLLKEIHQLIIKGGGRFRQEAVTIRDKSKLISPPFSEVSEIQRDLESLVNWFNEKLDENRLHPLILSSVFHHNLVKIHPFIDGNGRLARVITSLILLSFNIPPPISKSEDRTEYLNTLRNADGGDFEPIVIFIGNKIIQSMNYALFLNR